jgi:hypothetical protein
MCVDNPEAENQKAAWFRRLEHNSRYAPPLLLSMNVAGIEAESAHQDERHSPAVETAIKRLERPTYPQPANRLLLGRNVRLSIPIVSQLCLVGGIQHVVTSSCRANEIWQR